MLAGCKYNGLRLRAKFHGQYIGSCRVEWGALAAKVPTDLVMLPDSRSMGLLIPAPECQRLINMLLGWMPLTRGADGLAFSSKDTACPVDPVPGRRCRLLYLSMQVNMGTSVQLPKRYVIVLYGWWASCLSHGAAAWGEGRGQQKTLLVKSNSRCKSSH